MNEGEKNECGKLGLQVEEFLPLVQKKMTSEDMCRYSVFSGRNMTERIQSWFPFLKN